MDLFLKAVIKHSRFLFAANGGFYACGLDLSDTVYVALPMYHMTGGVMGIGMALIHGCTTVIRRKFSASNFWTDCIKYDCTVRHGFHLISNKSSHTFL